MTPELYRAFQSMNTSTLDLHFVVLPNLDIFGHYFFKFVWPPPFFGDSNYMYIGPGEIVLQLTDTLFIFDFSLCILFCIAYISMSLGSLVSCSAIFNMLLYSEYFLS